jgi:ankyrin repeat protein
MSSFSSDDYREAQAAKSFYSDAVASVMNGDVNELTRIIHAFTARNPDVSMQEIMTHFHSEGKTILHLAAGSGHYSVFERLIHMCSDPKAIVNMADKAGFTPLINATIAESLPIMKHLIDLGADVNARNADGASAIHFAASDGSLERLELLTKHGADLSCMSKAGTPLHWACGKSRANAVRYTSCVLTT